MMRLITSHAVIDESRTMNRDWKFHYCTLLNLASGKGMDGLRLRVLFAVSTQEFGAASVNECTQLIGMFTLYMS